MIDPFVKWSTGGILVQLELDADHIRPSGRVDRPGLIESVRITIENQRVVAVLRCIEALKVPLDVVPARRPVRTRDSIQNPTIALAIPGRPVAVSKVALAADHELAAPENLPQVELRGPEVGFGSGIVIDPEVPQKMRIGTGAQHRIHKQHVRPRRSAGKHLKAAAAERGLGLERRHPVVAGGVGAMRTEAANAPVGGVVLHLR